MASHYEDWDDEPYDDDELNEDDETQMRNGFRVVKERIPDWNKHFTQKDAEKVLWDMYYDVDKTVAHLRNKFVKSPAPKAAPPKLASKPPEAASYPPVVTAACMLPPALEFWGISWKGVPEHRRANLVPPWRPAGGLLGGGGEAKGMSKLQALAAKRRQKKDAPTEKMGRLTLNDGALAQAGTAAAPLPRVEDAASAPDLTPNKRPSASTLDGHLSPKRQRGVPDTSSLRARHVGGAGSMAVDWDDDLPTIAPGPAKPSAFAMTLCAPAFEARPTNFADIIPFPYLKSPLFDPRAFEKPSPDDIVLAAQAKAGQKVPQKVPPKTVPKPKTASAAQDAPTNEMEALRVSDQARKGKRLDVVKLYQERLKQPGSAQHASFVVVGHIDAGKSTTMGRLLLDLGAVDNRTIEKYQKEAATMGKQSFALAWVLDTFAEERARGVTIDVAMKDFKTDKTLFTILDAPGHQDFVPNMIAGAGRADFGIVVIDGNTGAFEKGLKGQTNEHILLLRSFGVQRLIVATNKLDMVNWSKERFDEISNQLRGYLGKIGFRQDKVLFVPISGLHGDNVVRRSENPAAAWYAGPTVVEALEDAAATTAAVFAQELDKPLRLQISETYKSNKGERLVCGRITAGTLQIGDHVTVQPGGEAGHVRGITVNKEPRDWAVTGENIEISLGAGVALENISWGDVVCPSGAPAQAGTAFTMRGLAFGHLLPMPLEVHRGRLKADGQITSMPALLDKASGEVVRKRPKVMPPGSYGLVRFTTAMPVVLERGQRIVLRSEGQTVAAGVLE